MIVLGKIIDTPAVTDDEGNVITPPTYKSGWHVDAPYAVPELEPYRIEPQAPRHTYAGATTYHYRFADEAEFETFRAQHTDEDGNWQLTPPPPKAPKVVTMRQARLALLQAGLLDQVPTAIGSLPEPDRTAAEIEWEYSQVVERQKPFVQMLAPALGLSDAELDDLFRLAATL